MLTVKITTSKSMADKENYFLLTVTGSQVNLISPKEVTQLENMNVPSAT